MKNFKTINELVIKFIDKVINEPLIFFSEADLQSLLYGILINKYKKNFNTSYERGDGSETKYKTSQIHREYGTNEIAHSRIDIVFFDTERIKYIDSPNLTIKGKYIEPEIGFELGTHKISDFTEHLENDIDKLKKLKRGYLIYIMRDETKSASGTKNANKTKEKIKTKIEIPLSNFVFPENIIPLIFYIKIQKKETNIWGKCNFYNPKEKKFIPIALTNIKPILSDYLNEL